SDRPAGEYGRYAAVRRDREHPGRVSAGRPAGDRPAEPEREFTVIVKGGSRKSGAFFATHLMKTEENERVSIAEMKGLYAEDVPEAFRELKALAAGTRAENYFYHASINPREDELLTSEQWEFAVDRLEHNLGLDGHARFQVEHEKEGRTHRHIVWSRVDPDTMTITSDSFTYLAHDHTRAELEQAFHHEPTPPTPQPSQRRSREIHEWENFRAQESGIDAKEVKAEVTALWQHSDSGSAFVAALEDSGYTLCQGDRGYCIIDSYGDTHSLVRRLDGVKTAELREYLSGMPLASLPTVAEASAAVRARNEAEEEGSTGGATLLVTEEQAQREPHVAELGDTNPKLRVLNQLAEEHRAQEAPDPRAAWFAENLPDTYPVAANARAYAELVEADMRANDCELPFTQGRTWEMWADNAMQYFRERAESLSEQVHDLPPELQERLEHLKDTVTDVKDRLSTFWQDFVKEGREREPPEIQEPELER
ncbi:MAG TPA: relaxase/mobilization nuclease domain-containing protein, partial [Nitrospira sp.]|nr:relaxase/mobilization nuclease domain-containing protein [Nitrospira sp.]